MPDLSHPQQEPLQSPLLVLEASHCGLFAELGHWESGFHLLNLPVDKFEHHRIRKAFQIFLLAKAWLFPG